MTRRRILESAERLVIDNGYAATSLDQVIAEAKTSKGAFFHHFDSKLDLGRALVEGYAAADRAHLEWALQETEGIDDPAERLIALLRLFEDGGDDLMAAQSSCLYVAVLTERQLVDAGAAAEIDAAVVAWREAIAALLRDAFRHRGVNEAAWDMAAVADHVFTTFEGAFLLCRATGESRHMRAQLRVLRQLVEAVLGRGSSVESWAHGPRTA